MPHQLHSNPPAPPTPSNAFSSEFLRRLDERDEPITSAEADMAGPWFVLPVPGAGYGVFREGEHPSRGFRPAAVFADRFLALVGRRGAAWHRTRLPALPRQRSGPRRQGLRRPAR